MRRLVFAAAAALALFPRTVAFGGLNIYPPFIFLNSPNRAISLNVSNNSLKEEEVWVDFRYGYPIIDDSGRIVVTLVDSATPGEPSAVPWIRVFPERFVLGPQESQAVRLIVTPPPSQAAGEYWARVIFHMVDKKPPVVRGDTKTVARVGFRVLTDIDIPFHFRSGRVSTGLNLTDMRPAVANGLIRIVSTMQRVGNASYWGTFSAKLRDDGGKIVAKKDNNIVVYKNLRFESKLDVSQVKPGTYTLEVEISSKRHDLKPESRLVTQPVTRNFTVTIP